MRVALVTPYDLDMHGGVQQHVTHLASGLRKLGDDVLLMGPGRVPGDNLTPLGVPIPIPSNGSISRVALSPLVWRRTTSAIRDFEPDITHVHEPTVPLVGPAAVFGNRSPVVATFHAWSDRDRGYRMLQPLTARLLERIDACIAVSPAAAAFHAGALGVSESIFSVIPNGVDVARFRDREPLDEMSGAPSLLFVGSLTPRKGLDVLIEAFVDLKSTKPEVRLFVVGDGPDKERCMALLPDDLEPDVVFVGRVSNEELPRFYASADLFVAPARGGESFGIVLTEAMAAGTAVVASDTPGYASVITDGVNGRLVPVGDSGALADALGSLLDSPDTRRSLAEGGTAEVTRYDWPVVTAQIRDLYEDVLSNKATAA